jgi:hypothetical protein
MGFLFLLFFAEENKEYIKFLIEAARADVQAVDEQGR